MTYCSSHMSKQLPLGPTPPVTMLCLEFGTPARQVSFIGSGSGGSEKGIFVEVVVPCLMESRESGVSFRR